MFLMYLLMVQILLNMLYQMLICQKIVYFCKKIVNNRGHVFYCTEMSKVTVGVRGLTKLHFIIGNEFIKSILSSA